MRRFSRQESSGNKTFFWGTIPIVPRGGLDVLPENVTVPLDSLVSPPRIESVVDFPALVHVRSC